MSRSEQPPIDEEDEMDLAAAFRLLWRYKYVIGLTGFAAGLVAVVLALTATPIFRAEVIVTDVRDSGMGAATSFANQLSGLASLAGVTVGQSGDTNQAQAVLDSNRLAEEFIKRNNLLPVLFGNSKEPPTLWKGVKSFKEGALTVRKDTRRGTTSVAIEWTDPVTAANWANGFVALANELIRRRVQEDASRNIAYLNEQLIQTNVVELRKVMYNIIENETKTLMLARGRAEYAFEVVDPAVAPELRVRPKRTMMVLVGLVLGGSAGIVIAYILEANRRRKRRISQNSNPAAANAAG